MSGFDHLDLIWLSERNMAVIYVSGDVPHDYVSAAIILKGADGTDQFIPFEGYLVGAPIGFSIGRDEIYRVSVIGFGPSTEPVELAMWTLDKEFLAHGSSPSMALSLSQTSDQIDMSLLGFGERSQEWQGKSRTEIGFNRLDYSIQGGVEYGDLLSTFLQDMRGLDDETFTSFFVTATPSHTIDDEVFVGPSLHLRPMHHFHFGLSVQCRSLEIEEEDERIDAGTIYGDDEDLANPMEGAAILSRHGGFEFRDVPELILNAGSSREQVDFLLANAYQIHWRRQFENWSSDDLVAASGFPAGSVETQNLGGARGEGHPFHMQPFLERSHLLQHDGQHFFRFEIEDAIIGDVIGVVFSADEASLDIDLHIEGELKYQLQADQALMFIFMGADGFVPLTDDILKMPENLGVSARLEGHIDQGLKSVHTPPSLKRERRQSGKSLLERDFALQEILETEALQEVASDAPFGPELMVYRDHILRVAHSADMAHWMADLSFASMSTASKGLRRGKLIDMLRFDMFNKAPQLAHALVFNQSFRQKFQTKPIDPHSFQMPVLEYLMSKLYSDPVIDWAMRLKGESQAILWHLVLKRPLMIEQLYDLKLEPDIALNPFDDQVLSHVETALQDSHQINVDLIEKKVIPLFQAMGEDDKAKDLSDFAHALNFGAEGKALSLGELSVCLSAVERASEQWALWCEQASIIFQPLVEPLVLELPLFEGDVSFETAKNADELRNSIGHLIERLIKEQGLSGELLDQGLEFIQTVETNVLLGEISKKLDLALKYQRDLAAGVSTLFDEFDVTPEDLHLLHSLSPETWPTFGDFPAGFADPLKKQQRSSKSTFDKLIKKFAHKAHPNDELFHKTLIDALSDLESSLPLLHWLEVGQDMENRVRTVQKKLNTALLKVNPASVKLRRSKVLSEAVKDIVEAERLGPVGWPLLVSSLDVIEQDLSKDLM